MTNLPAELRRLPALSLLNAAAVGLAMAPIAASAFAGRVPIAWGGSFDPRLTLAVAGSSALLGAAWAAVVRSHTAGRGAWAASVPLASLAAALASSAADLMGSSTAGSSLAEDVVTAATVYAIVWLPVLAFLLLGFGPSIARAKRLAAQGLSGEERGERLVGFTCVVWSLVALGLLGVGLGAYQYDSFGLLAWRVRVACAAGGALAGGAAGAISFVRERRRRRFVAEVEAGAIPGYRIDPAPAGKVLVRLSRKGEGEEEVYQLDASGAALRPLREPRLR